MLMMTHHNGKFNGYPIKCVYFSYSRDIQEFSTVLSTTKVQYLKVNFRQNLMETGGNYPQMHFETNLDVELFAAILTVLFRHQ